MKPVFSSITASLILLLATPLTAAELVREFSGTGNTTTADFTVESPWIIDWRLDSDFDRQISLDMVLIDAVTGQFVGGIKSGPRNNITYRSNGVRLLRVGGRYRLRISSSLARWSIKIQQLTEEEAELYTPKGPAQ
jgi:hypothetical protein